MKITRSQFLRSKGGKHQFKGKTLGMSYTIPGNAGSSDPARVARLAAAQGDAPVKWGVKYDEQGGTDGKDAGVMSGKELAEYIVGVQRGVVVLDGVPGAPEFDPTSDNPTEAPAPAPNTPQMREAIERYNRELAQEQEAARAAAVGSNGAAAH